MDRFFGFLLLSLCFLPQIQASPNPIPSSESDRILSGEGSSPVQTWEEWIAQDRIRNVLLPIVLFLGFQFLVLELKYPGFGGLGFLAFCSFCSYLWICALSGTANWTEIFLFLIGALLIVFELMIFPCLGFCGLCGMAAVLISLMLANQNFLIPSTAGEWSVFRHTLIIFLIASVGMILSGRILFHMVGALYIPKDDSIVFEQEKIVDYSSLSGKSGVSVTSLVPAGKGLIEGQWFHVVAEGNYLEQNKPFTVVSVEGNRIVVRPK